MFRALEFGLILSIGVCSVAFGLTGSGDSPVGPLDTVPPAFSALVAMPSEAAAGDMVTISFEASESLDTNPAVMVNGNPAAVVSGTKSTTFSYLYEVDASDALGAATISINGADPVGNFGALSDSSTLEIVEPAAALSVQAWPLALVLLGVALAILTLRRRGALVGAFMLIAPVALAQGPSISNVTFIQQPTGTGTEVVITYDLVAPNGPSDITVFLSKDGGVDDFGFPVTSLSGDLTGMSTGTGYTITWDIASDYPNENIPNAQLRVTAEDDFAKVEMIPVPAGSFEMGNSGIGDDGTFSVPDELPAHTVTLSAYEIGKFEVTNQQVCDVYNWADDQGFFTTVDATTATAFGQELLDLDDFGHIEYVGGLFQPVSRTGDPGGATVYSMADQPAVEISWYGAVAFCNWLSQLEGLTPVYDTNTWTADFVNDGFHLPTEAQWERAAAWDSAGAGKHWIYGFTSDTLTGKDRANYTDNNPNRVNPLGLTSPTPTSPVGWFDGDNVSPNGGIATQDSASPIGAYDMSGNVWEWSHDWYDSGYYATSPTTDPQGPLTGSNRVLRGASWINLPQNCRTAQRFDYPPELTLSVLGFRLAR